MALFARLIRILGARPAATFGVVTGLVGAALATVHLTSRYALKLYVEDQLARIPWDVALYQERAGRDLEAVRDAVARTPGVARVETLAFLRARLGESRSVTIEVNGQPLTTPWLSLLAASDLSILPPEIGLALGAPPLGTRAPGARRPAETDGPAVAPRASGSGRTSPRGAVIALVGPERAMGPAFLALQGARDFALRVAVADQPRLLFSTPVSGVVRLDRDELNRWLLDQTGSVTYVPAIGVVLLMPFRPDVLARFDLVAAGLVPADLLEAGETEEGHAPLAEYQPEIVVLGRYDRGRLISGWDIGGSLQRVAAVNQHLRLAAQRAVLAASGASVPAAPTGSETDLIAGFVVDSTTEVLLGRMEAIARLVGAVALLVALPLLWMGWVLAANLTRLLMLNERRPLGLMRLRGIPGDLLGRTLLAAIVTGGAVGGVLGLVAGSVGPLLLYEHGTLPFEVLLEPRQLLVLTAFLGISLLMAILVSRRLVRYATHLSPLEAAGRVTLSEATEAALTFGPFQAAALLLGLYVLVVEWLASGAGAGGRAAWPWLRRALDFVGLPLFLYGLATLIAANRRLFERALAPAVRPLGGALGPFAVRHLAVKPHRMGAFLLIIALMASVSLYPTIASRSFADKAVRGARVQLGADWQLLFNTPELVDVTRLQGPLAEQLDALEPPLAALVARLGQVPGVRGATWLLEGILPHFYLPGYGLRGVPLFLIGDVDGYLGQTYSEPELGLTDQFARVIGTLGRGALAVSPPVAEFWRLQPGTPVLVGLDTARRVLMAETGGVVAYLPGLPPRTVTDRQGFVQARIDYLNYLFANHGYLVTAARNPHLAGLRLLLPRAVVLLRTEPGIDPGAMARALIAALPIPPLEVHHLREETAKIATDMYIALALANMRIYLMGGLFLALVAMLAIAGTNYVEDRRTLALLRIRGASPGQMWRFLMATLLAPAALGLLVGVGAAVMAGFGLANYVWALREIQTVVQLLPTRLVIPPLSALVLGILVAAVVGVISAFSGWVFRRTAHQRIQEA